MCKQMKKSFVINIILQIFLFVVSALYSFQIASGWNGLIILVTGAIAILCSVIDIIGLITLAIIKHVKRKRQQNDESLVATTEKKKIWKIVLKIIFLIILYGATAFSAITLGTTMIEDEATYHIFDARHPEKVHLTADEKIIQDTRRTYKNAEFIYKETENRYNEQYTEQEDWEKVDVFYFRDIKTGLDFEVKRYIEHGYSAYYEVVTNNFDYAYRAWIAKEIRSRIDIYLHTNYIDNIKISNLVDIDIYVSKYAYLNNRQAVEDFSTDIVSTFVDALKEIDIYNQIEPKNYIRLLVIDENGICNHTETYDWNTKQFKCLE